MVEWHSTPTIVTRVRAPDPGYNEGRVCCCLFFPGFPIFLPPQNKHFLILIRSHTCTLYNELLALPLFVGKQITLTFVMEKQRWKIRCSGMFRCSGVFRGVPVFLVLVHASKPRSDGHYM